MSVSKKILLAVCALFLCMTAVYADDLDDIINEEEKSTEYKNLEQIDERDGKVSMHIDYYPSVGEARFVYSTLASSFDEGDAVATTTHRIQQFMVERSYYSYTYTMSAVIRTDKTRKLPITSYTVYVSFSR